MPSATISLARLGFNAFRPASESARKLICVACLTGNLLCRITCQITELRRGTNSREKGSAYFSNARMTEHLWTRLIEMERRYYVECPACGCHFWIEPGRAKTSLFDGSLQGFRCPGKNCREGVPWKGMRITVVGALLIVATIALLASQSEVLSRIQYWPSCRQSRGGKESSPKCFPVLAGLNSLRVEYGVADRRDFLFALVERGFAQRNSQCLCAQDPKNPRGSD